ncbi:hypothetical protein [Candidatus Leptofilum sp.]|uniref:hypothetical protein n=1 Tax=Candidatus Leptofilum sp. TaxID=3241576 RepID=UPI003B5A8181
MEIFALLFWLLLLGAAVCVVWLRFEKDWGWPTAVPLLGISLLTWLILRTQLPLTTTFLAWSANGILPDWTWRIDSSSWGITIWLLLVATTVSLYAYLQPGSLADKPAAPASILLLTAAALTAVWSDSFTGLLAGLTLLLASWLAMLWLAGERSNRFLFKGAILLMGLLLAWPIGSSRTSLLAAALLLNVWPLPLWQPKTAEGGTAVSMLTPLLPPLAGALLLVRLLPVAQLSPGVSLLLTVLGLVGFFRGVQLAWNRLHLPGYAVTALLLAQSHLLLLAAIWVGVAGVLAELRTILLAGGALYLLVQQPTIHNYVRTAVGSVALASLAGAPLTATFASRAGLYSSWLADGRWALVLVLGLLHIPLIMAGIWLLTKPNRAATNTSRTSQDWLREASPILPAMGLLSVRNVDWTAVPLLVLLVLALTAVAGIFLPRLVGQPQDVRLTLRQALGTEQPPFANRLPTLKQLGIGLQTAVNDAADVLDGDSGLLWLLLLAVIIILIG